jgi:predicted nucleotidyltransferase
MRTTPPASFADSLLGRTRAGLLGHVLGHPDEWFHLRQIARESGASAGTAHRELQALVDLGLLLRESSGAAVRFKANTEHPVFPELQSLLAKTGGVSALIRSGLATLGDAVETAFIYGSVARGEQRASSDIDLMVIGNVSLVRLLKALRPAIETLRREVNPTVYTREEFARKAREGHSFVERVLGEPKIFLKGDARELGQSGENRKAAPARSTTR